MPHKHVRARGDDPSKYNLPPTQLAKPLPVGKHAQTVFTDDEEKRKRKAKRKNAYKADDTPKSFARLMQFQSGKKLANALDNGEPRSKKRKRETTTASTTPAKPPKPVQQAPTKTMEMPKIQPGEKLSEFAARVDQALPVTGLTRKGKSDLGPKDRQTKTEKRLHKMYAEWRKEDARRKELVEEAQEEAEEEDEDEGGENLRYEDKDAQEDAAERKGSKKRRKRMIGEQKDDDDDPWAELKSKRDEPKGLHDVAKAPPEFKTIPREKFKVRNGAVAQVADVPNAAGSLKRREELGATRRSVIEQYRAIMSRGAVA